MFYLRGITDKQALAQVLLYPGDNRKDDDTNQKEVVMKEHKAAKPFTWVKDKEGNTYLCPKEELVDPKGLNEEELKRYCIDESTTPPWAD
jgi:hypothetical protein